MVDLPSWAWIVLASAGGLALGVAMGALPRKPTAPAVGRSRAPKPEPHRAEPSPPAGAEPSPDTAAAPAVSGTPQQRLLERLREQNLQLAEQLRTVGDQHARQMSERLQEQQAEQLRQDRHLEEMRQNHSAEFSQLLSVVFEQVDRIQVNHGRQTQVLEAEVERLRQLARLHDDGMSDDATGPDAQNARDKLTLAARDVRQAEFAATRALESLRQR